MQPRSSDWYRTAWSLDCQQQFRTEETEQQVDFLVRTLPLTGGERILDLACGFGRHALALARRGYTVVGVDLTPAYIQAADLASRAEGFNATFQCMDIRDVGYYNEFDVVLSMADGAVGYLETDEENLKIFDAVARALKSGGKHFLDVCNAAHAERYFPKKWWEIGEHALALAQFEWVAQTHRMLYGGWNIPYNHPAGKPEINEGDPIRLYTVEELRDIYAKREMDVVSAFSTYDGKPATNRELQLLVVSQKHQ
ncbi:MAG: class I SAM-dependent methyltransferase [Eubacteriales bacterium]|nr:class I SAM-dependent methyltransferase [Eubacteriales bacterium]